MTPTQANHPETFPCGQTQGVHLTLEELCYVADKSWYGVSAATKQTAAAIAMAESNGWTGAVGDCNIGYSLGLWQIHVPAWKATVSLSGDAFNAYDNGGMATVVYEHGGFKNWSTYTNNSYQQYVPLVQAAWPKKTRPKVAGSTAGISGAIKELPQTADAAKEALSPSALAEAVPGVPQAESVAQGIADIGIYLGKGAAWLGNPHNWLRIAFVGLGAGVIIAGLAKLVGVNASTVAGVVPGGKLATAAGSKLGSAEAGSAKSSFSSARSQAKKKEDA